MGEIDVRECIEILTEIIHERGEVVFRLYWDSGGPGAAQLNLPSYAHPPGNTPGRQRTRI